MNVLLGIVFGCIALGLLSRRVSGWGQFALTVIAVTATAIYYAADRAM